MSEDNKISKEQVEKVAHLARIEISKEEKEKFTQDLASVLDYFQDIVDVDASGVESFDHYDLRENNLRKDEAKPASDETREKIRKNFPDGKDNYLKVKAVLKG